MASKTTGERAALLRIVNDKVYEFALEAGGKTTQRFVCECDDMTCQRVTWLTLEAYARRSDKPLTAHD